MTGTGETNLSGQRESKEIQENMRHLYEIPEMSSDLK